MSAKRKPVTAWAWVEIDRNDRVALLLDVQFARKGLPRGDRLSKDNRVIRLVESEDTPELRAQRAVVRAAVKRSRAYAVDGGCSYCGAADEDVLDAAIKRLLSFKAKSPTKKKAKR